MSTDDEARRAGFANAAEMDAAVQALEEEHFSEVYISAGAPTKLDLLRQLHGLDVNEPPLTIGQACARFSVSDSTVRRTLPVLAAMDPPGARRKSTGKRAPWLIDAAALAVALRDRTPVEVAPAKPTPRPTRRGRTITVQPTPTRRGRK